MVNRGLRLRQVTMNPSSSYPAAMWRKNFDTIFDVTVGPNRPPCPRVGSTYEEYFPSRYLLSTGGHPGYTKGLR